MLIYTLNTLRNHPKKFPGKIVDFGCVVQALYSHFSVTIGFSLNFKAFFRGFEFRFCTLDQRSNLRKVDLVQVGHFGPKTVSGYMECFFNKKKK